MINNFSKSLLVIFVGLTANTSFAVQAPVDASNATGVGAVVDSRTFNFTNDFNHDGVGTFVATNFTSGVRVDQISLSGTTTLQNATSFAAFTDFALFSLPGTTSAVGDPLTIDTSLPFTQATTPFSFNVTQVSTFRNAGTGTFDSADVDGLLSFDIFPAGVAGEPNAISTNVSLTVSQLDFEDSDASASFGTLANGVTATAFGELATLGVDGDGDGFADGITDSFAFTVAQDGLLDVLTNDSAGPGVLGTDLDTLVTIVDVATGAVLATNDDIDFGGGNLFSQIDDLAITAGDYEVQVSGAVAAAQGDYGLSVSFVAAVPEPSSSVILLSGGIMALLRRRRRS